MGLRIVGMGGVGDASWFSVDGAINLQWRGIVGMRKGGVRNASMGSDGMGLGSVGMDGLESFREAQTSCIQASSKMLCFYTYLAAVTCNRMEYDDDLGETVRLLDFRMRVQHRYDIERCLERYKQELRLFQSEGNEPGFHDVPYQYLPSQRGRVSSR